VVPFSSAPVGNFHYALDKTDAAESLHEQFSKPFWSRIKSTLTSRFHVENPSWTPCTSAGTARAQTGIIPSRVPWDILTEVNRAIARKHGGALE